jgi:hypothetical protein
MSLARRDTSVSFAVTRQMARAAWVSAFMVIRLRRMSACSMIGLMPALLADMLRPCRRSLA